ncbi:hypothetical protein NEOKW01_1584 [Nematocida sp. AWRm80]|nr:hypothetical protein NEOKW01_1584 [Nematocida sp. AWRm80]
MDIPVVQCLTMQYLNERGSKRMLPFNSDLVERVLYLIQRQNIQIEQSIKENNKIHEHIYKIEVDRIEWIVTEYLLIRLEKIRNNYYIDDTLLSPEEQEYKDKYIDLQREEQILIEKEDIPGNREETKTEYSGIYVLEDIPEILLGEDLLSLSSGDFIIADTSSMHTLVDSLSVVLI